MSRIGKKPVELAGVEVSSNGNVITFKNGKLSRDLDTKGHVDFKVEGSQLVFASKSDAKQDRAFWGTYRALANNIIIGLTKGFEKKLEINGVGYRAAVKGKVLELQLGFSHPINYDIPEGVAVAVEKNIISIKSADNQQLGQIAAEIRGYRPPEPYKGKGVKYVEERIIRKAGKTAKK